MKLTRTLAASPEAVDVLIEQLASQDAGRPAQAGMKYRKKITGMNGAQQTVQVHIDTLEPGCYSVRFAAPKSTTTMSYKYHPVGDGQTRLEYEETASADGTMGTLNQKISSLLFSHMAKKQGKRRLDLFERQLGEMQWRS